MSTPLLLPSERLDCRRTDAPPEWMELLLGGRRVVRIPATSAGRATTAEHEPAVIFPGSFNPLHQGHARMAEIAAERLGQPVWLEISITNVDKPPLDFLTIRERLEKLTAYNVCLTRAATFVEKTEVFPGATFVVGADTLSRIADEKYYHGETEDRDAAIAAMEGAAARFLVFGRTVHGRFLTVGKLSLSSRLAAICEEVPEAEFREDVASADLRTAHLARDGNA